MIGEGKFNGSRSTAARSRMGGRPQFLHTFIHIFPFGETNLTINVAFGACHGDDGIHLMYFLYLVTVLNLPLL